MRLGTAPWATVSAAVMEAALTNIRGMLFVYFLLCPLAVYIVYGAFVAAVVGMVSVLAWACLGCSFLGICF